MQNIAQTVERISKKSFIRIILIAIPVTISAIYTNHKNREYEQENAALEKRLKEAESDVVTLKSNMLVISLADDSFPNPKWIKSVDLMMLKLNKAFEDVYLKPYGLSRSDYIGEYDYDIWPANMAAKFRDGDRMVLQAESPMTFYENVSMDTTQPPKRVKVTKYPIKVNGVIVGVGGYVDLNPGEDEN